MQKVYIKTDNLKRAIAKLAHSFNAKTILPALNHVHCNISGNEMIMTTSDMELTGIVTIEVESKSDVDFLMPFLQLGQIVGVINTDEVTLVITKTKTTIQSGFDEYELKASCKLEEFIKVKDEDLDNEVELIPAVVSAIKSTSVLLERSSIQPWKNAVLVEFGAAEHTIVATNASSLMRLKVQSEVPGNGSLMLSERIVKALDEVPVPTLLKFSNKHLLIEQLNYKLSTPQVETKYPPYSQIIPNVAANLVVDRDAFLVGVKKCNLVSEEFKFMDIKQVKEKEILLLAADEKSDLKIQTKIEMETEGQEMTKSIYTLELLKVLGESKYKQLALALTPESKMLVLTTPEDPNYLSLVMLKA